MLAFLVTVSESVLLLGNAYVRSLHICLVCDRQITYNRSMQRATVRLYAVWRQNARQSDVIF